MKHFFLLLSLILIGCSHLPENRVRCPNMSILKEFSKHIMVHEGIPLRTEIDSLIPTCAKEAHHIAIEFRLRMTSFRPLEKSHDPLKTTVSYFVAVIDDTGQVLSRSDHSQDISFSEKQTTCISLITLKEVIPLGQNVNLYVGFNLSEAQINQAQNERLSNG